MAERAVHGGQTAVPGGNGSSALVPERAAPAQEALRSRLERASRSFQRADETMRHMLELRTGLASLPAYLLMWTCEALESWVLLLLLGFDVGFADALAIEATVSVVRALAFFVPAGIGFQEAGYLALLGTTGPGAAAATAFVFARRLREVCWIALGYVLLAARRRTEAARA